MKARRGGLGLGDDLMDVQAVDNDDQLNVSFLTPTVPRSPLKLWLTILRQPLIDQ